MYALKRNEGMSYVYYGHGNRLSMLIYTILQESASERCSPVVGSIRTIATLKQDVWQNLEFSVDCDKLLVNVRKAWKENRPMQRTAARCKTWCKAKALQPNLDVFTAKANRRP